MLLAWREPWRRDCGCVHARHRASRVSEPAREKGGNIPPNWSVTVCRERSRGCATCCRSIITAHAECYLFCGNAGHHGVVPRDEPGLLVQRAICAPRRGRHCAGSRSGRKVSIAGETVLHEYHHGHDERAEACARPDRGVQGRADVGHQRQPCPAAGRRWPATLPSRQQAGGHRVHRAHAAGRQSCDPPGARTGRARRRDRGRWRRRRDAGAGRRDHDEHRRVSRRRRLCDRRRDPRRRRLSPRPTFPALRAPRSIAVPTRAARAKSTCRYRSAAR